MKLTLYHAKWSGPSRTLLKDKPAGVEAVDIDTAYGEAERLGLRAVPTVVAFGWAGDTDIVLGMIVGPANWGKVEAWAKTLQPAG